MIDVNQVKLATMAMQRHSWEQGTVAQAFLEQGDTDTVIVMSKEAAYRQVPDGRTAVIGFNTAVTDPCSCGEALLYSYEKTGDESFKTSTDKLLKWALTDAPRNENGIVYHLTDKPQFWVDSFYMLPPFLAKAERYKEAIRQINGYWSILFSSEKKLLSHIWDDKEKKYIRKDFWGVGNGWAMAGMARVIKMLPNNMQADRELLIQKVKTLIDSSLQYIRDDGLFHDVIDNPSTFVETNFAQMMAYTIYRGVKNGWLSVEYLSAADKMRKAANKKVDKYGLVQDVCGAPTFDRPGVAPEGQAFCLLMEAAARDGIIG